MELPSTLDRFLRGITEYQTKLLGVKNSSPVIGYEIRRFKPSQLRLQFAVPSIRLERKVRTHLSENVPSVAFDEGTPGLPVSEGDTVGVGVLTLRRKPEYPLRTEFERPPINSVVSALHRHAMRDSRVIVQMVFKPLAGGPVRRRLRRRQASQESQRLREGKVGIAPGRDRDATAREKQQARQIDRKSGSRGFEASIRVLVIGAGKYTASRIKEITGGFNIYANTETGQSLRTTTVRSLRKTPILKLVKAVRDRSPSKRFLLSQDELAALVSLPDHDQENIQYSRP